MPCWNFIYFGSFNSTRVRLMTILLSETFSIVDHLLSNAAMCVCIMFKGWFYTPPKFDIVRWAMVISDCVLPLCKKAGSNCRQQPLNIVSLSAVFASQTMYDVWNRGSVLSTFCHWSCFLWYPQLFASKEDVNNVPSVKQWLHVWRPCDPLCCL